MAMGKYVQVQVYISDYNERLLAREMKTRGIGMTEILEEVKQDAIEKAMRGEGVNEPRRRSRDI